MSQGSQRRALPPRHPSRSPSRSATPTAGVAHAVQRLTAAGAAAPQLPEEQEAQRRAIIAESHQPGLEAGPTHARKQGPGHFAPEGRSHRRQRSQSATARETTPRPQITSPSRQERTGSLPSNGGGLSSTMRHRPFTSAKAKTPTAATEHTALLGPGQKTEGASTSPATRARFAALKAAGKRKKSYKKPAAVGGSCCALGISMGILLYFLLRPHPQPIVTPSGNATSPSPLPPSITPTPSLSPTPSPLPPLPNDYCMDLAQPMQTVSALLNQAYSLWQISGGNFLTLTDCHGHSIPIPPEVEAQLYYQMSIDETHFGHTKPDPLFSTSTTVGNLFRASGRMRPDQAQNAFAGSTAALNTGAWQNSGVNVEAGRILENGTLAPFSHPLSNFVPRP